MHPLLIAILSGIGFLVAYHTYGRWLGGKIFRLSASAICPSESLRDGVDYVPTPRAVVFGHHFTSIAGTGPIVGPAIAIMWGWLPALLWVVLGSIFIGAVHDLGALVVSLRNKGQTVGDIAGRLINRRVRLLFLLVLFMALTIVLAIFGMVIAAVFRAYPAAIFPCMVQIPIAIAIGIYLHRRGHQLLIPSILALMVMYLTVIIGDENFAIDPHGVLGFLAPILHPLMHSLHGFNSLLAGWSDFTWVVLLLTYSAVASVLPVWTLLQPRDYINSLQLLSALGLILAGLVIASLVSAAPPVTGAEPQKLEWVAPMVNWNPHGAPAMIPFLFITIACGAISGFHCLVSSGTSSKQLKSEPDARFVGYGSMLTEGFLATLVIVACAAGLGLGLPLAAGQAAELLGQDGIVVSEDGSAAAAVGATAYGLQYSSWGAADALGAKVRAFVVGAANFVSALGVPMGVAVALMGVLVASFAATTLDTACRLQRYVVQELAATFLPRTDTSRITGRATETVPPRPPVTLNPVTWLRNTFGATAFAVGVALLLAAVPLPGQPWGLETAGKGGAILWPLFGATNQLLAGLAFLVIAFYLWRRGLAIWFMVVPMLFMLVVPAWAMLAELPTWYANGRYVLVAIAAATLALEAWMIVEAVRLFPRVRNIVEEDLIHGIEARPSGQEPG
ncbi:MAG: carbon starvation protein A [Phycisphaeraceae bacterium]|nr:carbon starvation protein A [Phycisphaeraceae bacterium]